MSVAGSAYAKCYPLREVVGALQDLHGDPVNAGALFQVASQLNP
jgi:hypothetical protein